MSGVCAPRYLLGPVSTHGWSTSLHLYQTPLSEGEAYPVHTWLSSWNPAIHTCIGYFCGVQCGWLLTTASLGDSRAVLDTGAQILQLSVDHRVATHRGERHRLERTGALIAPIDVSGEAVALRIAFRLLKPATSGITSSALKPS